MKQTIKLFNKRFNSIIPLALLVIIAAIVSGVFEQLDYGLDYTNSNTILVDMGGYYNYALYIIGFSNLVTGVAMVTFIFASFALALFATYRNEHKYSYNIGCTRGNNICANIMLGTALGLIIFARAIITFFISLMVFRADYEFTMINTFSASQFGIVVTGASIIFLLFSTLYSFGLSLTKLFVRNKLLFLLGLFSIISIYCAFVIIPINVLADTNAYYRFVISWKGQITLPCLGVIFGYGSYILLSYKMEVRR